MKFIVSPDRMKPAQRSRLLPAQVKTRIQEMDAPVMEVPAQVILYGADFPVILDGVAQSDEAGITTIVVPNGDMPPPGTPVQIFIFTDPDLAPVVIEGLTTGEGENGVIGLLLDIPDGISS